MVVDVDVGDPLPTLALGGFEKGLQPPGIPD